MDAKDEPQPQIKVRPPKEDSPQFPMIIQVYESNEIFYFFYTKGSDALEKIKEPLEAAKQQESEGNTKALDDAIKKLSPSEKHALAIHTCEMVPNYTVLPAHDAALRFKGDKTAQKLVRESVERLKEAKGLFPENNIQAIEQEMEFEGKNKVSDSRKPSPGNIPDFRASVELQLRK